MEDTGTGMDPVTLDGRVAIVTGGGQGIGRSSAIRLAQAGANVVLTDIRPEAANDVCREIEVSGHYAIAVPGDVSAKGDVETVVATALSKFGHIDILVNNAGICPIRNYRDVSESEWAKVLDINLKGLFLYCQAVAPMMSEQKGGSIVNVSSMGVWTGGIATSAPYVASKAGVIGVTHHFARYLGPDGVRVNAVAPGIIETEMVSGWSEDIKKSLAEGIPLRRFGTADEVARVVLFLASDLSSYVTGTTISITGGFLLD